MKQSKPVLYTDNLVEAVVFHDAPDNCERNCPGCYLKPHQDRMQLVDSNRQKEIDKLVLKAWQDLQRGGSISANQIIYAANTTKNLEKFYRNSIIGCEKKLQFLATGPIWSKDFDETFGFIMSNTSRNISLDDYKVQADKVWDWMCNARKGWFNVINLLWTPGVAKEMQGKLWIEGEPVLYLSMHKPIHGEKPARWQVKVVESMLDFYDYNKRANKEFNITGKNVQLDYCLDHLINNKDHGCRAGINMFNIHADGAITACPYSVKPKTYLQDYKNIGEAIRHVRELANSGKSYDWDNCKLRGIF